jgi:hypothetical protein
MAAGVVGFAFTRQSSCGWQIGTHLRSAVRFMVRVPPPTPTSIPTRAHLDRDSDLLVIRDVDSGLADPSAPAGPRTR